MAQPALMVVLSAAFWLGALTGIKDSLSLHYNFYSVSVEVLRLILFDQQITCLSRLSGLRLSSLIKKKKKKS